MRRSRTRLVRPSVRPSSSAAPSPHVPRRVRSSRFARIATAARLAHVRLRPTQKKKKKKRKGPTTRAHAHACTSRVYSPDSGATWMGIEKEDRRHKGRTPPSPARAAADVLARPNARFEGQEKGVRERKEGTVDPTRLGNQGRSERIACRPLVDDAADGITCHRPAAAQERLSTPKGLKHRRNRKVST